MIFQSLSSKLLTLKSQNVFVSLKFEPYTPWNERIDCVVALWEWKVSGIGHPGENFEYSKTLSTSFPVLFRDVLTLAKDKGDEPKDQWLIMFSGWYCLAGKSLYQEKPHNWTLDSEVLSLDSTHAPMDEADDSVSAMI